MITGKEDGLKVLIVEDNADLLEVLVDIVQRHFPKVFRAGSATEALQQVKTYNPDFLIADIRMEGGSGIDFLTQVRKEGYDAPALLCSAFPNAADLQRAIGLGVVDFIEKPFTTESVETAIFRMIEIQVRNFNLANMIATGAPEEQITRQRRLISLHQAANGSRHTKDS